MYHREAPGTGSSLRCLAGRWVRSIGETKSLLRFPNPTKNIWLNFTPPPLLLARSLRSFLFSWLLSYHPRAAGFSFLRTYFSSSPPIHHLTKSPFSETSSLPHRFLSASSPSPETSLSPRKQTSSSLPKLTFSQFHPTCLSPRFTPATSTTLVATPPSRSMS